MINLKMYDQNDPMPFFEKFVAPEHRLDYVLSCVDGLSIKVPALARVDHALAEDIVLPDVRPRPGRPKKSKLKPGPKTTEAAAVAAASGVAAPAGSKRQAAAGLERAELKKQKRRAKAASAARVAAGPVAAAAPAAAAPPPAPKTLPLRPGRKPNPNPTLPKRMRSFMEKKV